MKHEGQYLSLRKGAIWQYDADGNETIKGLMMEYADKLCLFSSLRLDTSRPFTYNDIPLSAKSIMCKIIDEMHGTIYLDAYEKDLTHDKQAAKDYIINFNDEMFEEEIRLSKFTFKKFFKNIRESIFNSSIR